MSGEATDRYGQAGVDYETLDAAKRAALEAAASTGPLASARGAELLEHSRGEPAVVLELAGRHLGFVLECLGTKSMVARAYQDATGEDRFASIGYDTVASVVNDCCCVGALPVVVNAYFATGSSAWYEGSRASSLIEGWRRACEDAGASWGGGESPTLSGLVGDREIDLAGSAVGLVPAGVAPLVGDQLAAGDEIVLVASSGLHANGASLVRSLAAALPEGLLSMLGSGRTLAEAVLEESVIYVALVAALLEAEVPLHYVSHITGHGWRKLMRARAEFTYRIELVPEVPEVLAYLVAGLDLSSREAYGTLNMGAGLALYVAPGSGGRVLEIARATGYDAKLAGQVEVGPKQVLIEPLSLAYTADELELR